MGLTYEEAWNAKPDGRSRDEIFQSIVADIQERAGGLLSDTEARAAARHLIAFCRELSGLSQEETIGNIDSMTQNAIVEEEHE